MVIGVNVLLEVVIIVIIVIVTILLDVLVRIWVYTVYDKTSAVWCEIKGF